MMGFMAPREMGLARALRGRAWWRLVVRPRQLWPSPRAKMALGLPILASLCTLILASRASAQGCAVCYQTAARAGVLGRAALRHGIVVLLVPAITLFSAILALIYSRRNLPTGRQPGPDSSGWNDPSRTG